jgi:hypothetical protein
VKHSTLVYGSFDPQQCLKLCGGLQIWDFIFVKDFWLFDRDA